MSSGIISNLTVLKPFEIIYNFENLLKALHFFLRKNANMHISEMYLCVRVCVCVSIYIYNVIRSIQDPLQEFQV